jgi:type I restriction enzyme, S subunit
VSIATAALGEVVDIKGGGTPSKANPSFWNGDIPWVSPKDMKRWEIDDAEDKITLEAVKNSATNLIPPNSILIVNRSGILKHTLPVGITRRSVAINQDLKALICKGRAYPEYIAHMVKAAEPIVLKWVRATTADNFSVENLRSLEIPVPPLDEQRRIAVVLNKADALRCKRERALELAESLLGFTFVGMFGDETGSRFAIRRLEEVTDQITDGAHFTPTYVDNGVPFLRVTDLQNKVIDWQGVKYIPVEEHRELIRRCKPEVGDVLLSKNGTIGIPRFIDWEREFSIFVSLCLIKPSRDILSGRFLASFLKTHAAQRQLRKSSKTGTVTNLHLVEIRKLLVPVPPLSVQRGWEDMEVILRRMEGQLSKAKFETDSLFRSLQHRAFSGQL